MPQVQKSQDQIDLELRINKCASLLRKMRSQLKSVRKRGKANREQLRRANRVDEQEQENDQEFDILCGLVERAKEKRVKNDEKQQKGHVPEESTASNMSATPVTRKKNDSKPPPGKEPMGTAGKKDADVNEESLRQTLDPMAW